MSDLRSQVASVIKANRTAKGMTQEDLADQANLSVQSISALENAKYLPAFDTLVTLIEILGIDITDIVTASSRSQSRIAQETKAKALLHQLDDNLLLVAIQHMESLIAYAKRARKV